MAQKLSPKELVTFKELLMANSIQTDALAQPMIDRGNWRYGISYLLIYGRPGNAEAESAALHKESRKLTQRLWKRAISGWKLFFLRTSIVQAAR